MYEGEIKINDQFEWAPYGTPGWPHAHCFCEVTDITKGSGGELLIWSVVIDSTGEAINDSPASPNSEDVFRESVKLHRRPPAINE